MGIITMKKKLLLLSFLACFSFAFTQITHAASSKPFEDACSKLTQDQQERSAACAAKATTKNPISGGTDSLLYKISRVIATVAGIAAVIIVIVGGISMITSDGDSQKFKNGRNTLIFAAVGLAIIVLAQSIITLVVNRVT